MAFASLVSVFLRDLARRKMVWILLLVTLGGIALNYGTTHVIEAAVGQGESWDVATKRAASQLDQTAGMLRGWLGFVVILLAAQVAPESRRNGTTQFMLSLGVRRTTLALAQFTALGLFITGAAFIAHAAFAVAGLHTGAVTGREVEIAWVGLLVPLLAVAAAAFSLSLTASAIETYIVFLGVPALTRSIPSIAHGFPHGFPRALARGMDNLGLFFPDLDAVISWPHLSYGAASGAPHAEWHWYVAQLVAIVTFWTVLGVWLQRHHDFGSRTAVK